MNWDDIQHYLEPENIGNAPAPVRLGVMVTIFSLIVGAGLWFDTKKQLEVLERVEQQEIKLKADFEVKAHQAAKLDLYREQLAEMEATFGALVRQLPETTEVESLLVDVSQTGLAAGLEIKKFKPSAEEKKGFYAELPIALEISGSFHQLATFISGIAALPRIVTIRGMRLAPRDKEETLNGKLNMTATATTYRYLQEDEQ